MYSQVIHAYRTERLGLLMNPIHADIQRPVVWRAKGVVVADDGLKVGVKTLVIEGRLPLLDISMDECVAFGILCALQVDSTNFYGVWAKNWLSGKDRSWEAARNVGMGDTWEAGTAAWEAAVRAAGAAGAANVWEAARAAEVAGAVAWTAVRAQRLLKYIRTIDFPALAQQSLAYRPQPL